MTESKEKKEKYICFCGSQVLDTKGSIKRHTTSNKHKIFRGETIIKKEKFVYNKNGEKIIKTKGRKAFTRYEHQKRYLSNPVNYKKHLARVTINNKKRIGKKELEKNLNNI